MAFFILQNILQIDNFLQNKHRDVRSSNIAFLILQEILQSHPFLMMLKFKTQNCQWFKSVLKLYGGRVPHRDLASSHQDLASPIKISASPRQDFGALFIESKRLNDKMKKWLSVRINSKFRPNTALNCGEDLSFYGLQSNSGQHLNLK